MPDTVERMGPKATASAARFDAGAHHRAKIGYLLLATEQTVQDDIYRLCPEGVGVHVSRVAIPDSITVNTLAAQADLLADAAALILPDGSLDVICYACTSGSLVIGEERVNAELKRGQPGAKPTSLIAGVLAGLKALKARKVAVGTPYINEINIQERDYMTAAGFDILDITGLGLEKDSDMVRVTPDFLAEFITAIDRPDADAVFLSCGALRSVEILDAVERAIDKPVIVSNQAMIWNCLRMAGIDDRMDGYGRLFREI